MHSKDSLENILKQSDLVKPKLEVLRLAEEINPKFREPHIIGGYLRNIILAAAPNDCDVVFQGYQLNQPGILEAVQEAEERLGIPHFPDWEFENTSATGYSGDFFEDNIGKYSYHSDYLTMLMMNTTGKLLVSRDKTLEDLGTRTYDLHFPGVEMWAKHRGNGRSYESCITGDLIRAFYLCISLDLTPSMTTAFLMRHFDEIFNSLMPDDQESRVAFWLKKTQGSSKYQSILDQFGVKVLRTK